MAKFKELGHTGRKKSWGSSQSSKQQIPQKMLCSLFSQQKTYPSKSEHFNTDLNR